MNTEQVVWTAPSEDSRGSMPIGNGEIGANVWVDRSGDLLFYLSRTDAWSENMRLLKLGQIRVALTPCPLTDTGARVARAVAYAAQGARRTGDSLGGWHGSGRW